jgi:small subunit ribosomal protein S5
MNEQKEQKDNRPDNRPDNRTKNRRPTRRAEKPRSEYDQKNLLVRRVARMTKGGRRFKFSVVAVIGNRKGSVGVGLGKGVDTALAVEKAVRDARKNMIVIKRTENNSIPFDVYAKYSSSEVMMMPAKGKGLIAGGAVRDILEYAGIKDVNAKIISGSKNPLNNARAAIKALKLCN